MVIKLNKHYDVMSKLRNDYFKLTKESEKIQSEINARDSFHYAKSTGLSLNREMRQRTCKLQYQLCEQQCKHEEPMETSDNQQHSMDEKNKKKW